MAADRKLLKELRGELRAAADPARAAGAQAYMKSVMPFLGLTVPVMRRITNEVSQAHAMPDAEITGHRPYRAEAEPGATAAVCINDARRFDATSWRPFRVYDPKWRPEPVVKVRNAAWRRQARVQTAPDV